MVGPVTASSPCGAAPCLSPALGPHLLETPGWLVWCSHTSARHDGCLGSGGVRSSEVFPCGEHSGTLCTRCFCFAASPLPPWRPPWGCPRLDFTGDAGWVGGHQGTRWDARPLGMPSPRVCGPLLCSPHFMLQLLGPLGLGSQLTPCFSSCQDWCPALQPRRHQEPGDALGATGGSPGTAREPG